MNQYHFLEELLPILYPTFYCRTDSAGNEFVLLDVGQEHQDISCVIADKTQFEAVENHFHIFGSMRGENKKIAREISVRIAQNLTESLKRDFPQKAFLVFLTMDEKGSTIVRFHQVWENESPYFDTKKFQYDGTEVMEWRME